MPAFILAMDTAYSAVVSAWRWHSATRPGGPEGTHQLWKERDAGFGLLARAFRVVVVVGLA